MLPCARGHNINLHEQFSQHTVLTNRQRRLNTDVNDSEHCARQGKVPLLSRKALDDMHIFVFVLALVHVVFCATTMVLGGAKIRQWKNWEDAIRSKISQDGQLQLPDVHHHHHHRHHQIFKLRAGRHWRKAAVVGWLIAFFKQFYGSVTESDYVTLRYGFVQLLLLVGAKLEHIITRLAKEVAETTTGAVKPSDEHFWFGRPRIVLYLIHFIMFENSFEIAFFFWIWTTYGFHSCIMDKVDYIIPRLIAGVIVQVLCSYSTLPLYALVTQMGSSMYGEGILSESMRNAVKDWAVEVRRRKRQKWSWKKAFRIPQKLSLTRTKKNTSFITNSSETHNMAKERFENVHIKEYSTTVDEANMTSVIEISCVDQSQVIPLDCP
ncbi:unnamed protein product [Ilex paraguariensis]|uniref:MLO-like protein n=1 Tax=Ilex paraguariensis TaxID=185542 RepID=A0ABC8SDT4_9AQUA